MRRLSRASVINDIERIAKSAVVGLGKHKWETSGVECMLDRHSYNGESYGFDVEVLRVCMRARSALKWQLFLVSEFWRNETGETVRI